VRRVFCWVEGESERGSFSLRGYEMTTAHDLLLLGIEALKAGLRAEARNLLTQVVQ
jgi:hypothetical protein